MRFRRLRAFGFGRPVIQQDLDEEFAQHIELLTAELADAGWEPTAARNEARRRFGDGRKFRQDCESIRARRRQRLALHGLGMDLRYAGRRFRQHPLVTAVVVATLALGIGAGAAIFTLVHGVLLKPLPLPDADRLAVIWQKDRNHPQLTHVSPPNFYDYRDRSGSFELMASYFATGADLTGGGEDPQRVRGCVVSADFFELLGVEAALGRYVASPDFEPAPADVVVVSHGLWQRRFGGKPNVVGRTLVVNDTARTVIGVMPAHFGFPELGTTLWVPDGLPRQDDPVAGSPYRAFRVRNVIGRLAEDVVLESAKSEVATIARQLEEAYPEANESQEAVVVSLEDQVVGGARPALLVLSGAVGLVLLLACANVAHLLLVQASAREREMAVRGALGAGAGRLVRQLFAEYLLLTLCGGALGVLVASGLVQVILRLSGDGVPRAHEVALGGTALAVTLVASLVAGLGFGLVPVLYARRSDLNAALRSGTREIAGTPTRRTHAAMVVAEVALAMPLLVGAGLLVKSVHRLQNVNPGFVAENVLAFDVTLTRRYEEPHEWKTFFGTLLERLEAVPGITQAGAALQAPILGRDVDRTAITLEGMLPALEAQSRMARHHVVTPGYFETLSIPLVSGRTFDGRDREDSPATAIVNQAMARRFWPGGNPIGKRFTHEMQLTPEEPTIREVIGVIADVRHLALTTAAEPQIYLPARQSPWFRQTILVRTSMGPTELAAALRPELARLDPDLPVTGLTALPEAMRSSIAQPHLQRWLLVTFATAALFLAAIGLYGVMAYTVARREHELGLRMALGADASAVLGLILKRGLVLTAIGTALGIAASTALSRWLAGQLFEVRPHDPPVYLTALGVVVAAAFLATLVPALRTLRISPSRALRD